jgi:uncharacterized protein YcnI
MPTIRRLVPTVVATALLAAPALAHITVNPREAPKGSFTKLTFRVPNERDDAGTTKVEVVFPEEQPIASVRVKPQTGWTYTIERGAPSKPLEAHGEQVTEVVKRITWEGGSINPGEFDEFEVSAGRMPEDVDQLVFKALQTYSSGEVVRWIEERTPGGEEPEHPAPVLELVDEAEGHAGAGGAGDPTEADAAGDTTGAGDPDSARGLAIAGIVIALLALVAAGAALVASRRTTGPISET